MTEDFKQRLPLKLILGELAALVMSRHLLSPLGLSVLGPEVASAFDKIQHAPAPSSRPPPPSICRRSTRPWPSAAR